MGDRVAFGAGEVSLVANASAAFVLGLTGVFAGVLLLSAIGTAINIMGIGPYYLQVIRGGLVLLAVLLDSLRRLLRPYYD